ncbi:hypothetical protein [Leptolyngbya ohadii]|nr:hypothetical protein [Leptolyngbya ohadii]
MIFLPVQRQGSSEDCTCINSCLSYQKVMPGWKVEEGVDGWMGG